MPQMVVDHLRDGKIYCGGDKFFQKDYFPKWIGGSQRFASHSGILPKHDELLVWVFSI